MIVIRLLSPPSYLRGPITKWLYEIDANVFVGSVNVKIADMLWNTITENIKNGKAIMAISDDSELGFSFRTYNYKYDITYFDDLPLITEKPVRIEESNDANKNEASSEVPVKTGWSKASRGKRRW